MNAMCLLPVRQPQCTHVVKERRSDVSIVYLSMAAGVVLFPVCLLRKRLVFVEVGLYKSVWVCGSGWILER